MTPRERRLFYELKKVIREIRTHGEQYIFFRDVKDNDGEPTGEAEEIASIRGFFHVSQGYVSRETNEGTETHSKNQPSMLCAYDETKEIKNNDYVLINGHRYNVVSKNNIQEYNILNDFSLEVVLDGNN